MKKLILLVLAGLLLGSCASSQKLLEQGKFKKAVNKAANNLREDPGDQKELRVLKEAYYQANRIDRERIEFLEKEGHDRNWVEIYNLYLQLDRRQNKIKVLPPDVRSEFKFTEYDDLIIKSKTTAADVAIERGQKLLQKRNKFSARRAYHEFKRAYELYPDYRNIVEKIKQAQYLGLSRVLFSIENTSDVILPANFDAELRKMSLKDINSLWVDFDTYNDTTKYYDYHLILEVHQVGVSPERIEKESYTDSKKIKDGSRYLLDANGNVKKDSLGNDIRVPNMVEVTAKVEETIQRKSAAVGGSLEFVSLTDQQVVENRRITVRTDFNHYSATAAGNRKALSRESRQKVMADPLPFPSNEEMLLDAAALLKERAKTIIAQNRHILER